MYSSQSGEFLAGLCTLVQLTTIQLIRWFLYSCTAHNQVTYWLVAVPLYSSQPYNLSEDFRTHVQLTTRWIIGWSLYSCTARNHTTYQKISVLMYSLQPGELFFGRCTLVQLTTIQLGRRFPYLCILYSSQSGELLASRCTLVQLTTIQLIRRGPYLVSYLYLSAFCRSQSSTNFRQFVNSTLNYMWLKKRIPFNRKFDHGPWTMFVQLGRLLNYKKRNGMEISRDWVQSCTVYETDFIIHE